jgi:glutamate N-acetyltransferase/amino-acid N-acetyltransferase
VSITAPDGFVASGVACGVKENGDPDLAVVATEDRAPVTAVAVFTANKATAAPVRVSRAHLAATGGRAAAVVLNSGNANAATGGAGVEHAERMCAATAKALGCAAEEVLVCSTGLIGIPLPVERIEGALPGAVAELGRGGGGAAARAILSTDTVIKEVALVERGFVVGGMAKGAAMLAPNMATMLAVLTTDAGAEPEVLQRLLQDAVDSSFNALTVDGCTSTNDTVILLAANRVRPDPAALGDALTRACGDLAAAMAGDAEGATKVVRVEVTGAASDEEARRGARAIAESQLVKCSFFGEDPYWGRVVSELGACGITFELDRVSVTYGDVTVCQGGIAVDHDAAALRRHMAERHLRVGADLGVGSGRGHVLTNDLTYGYIDENKGTS